MPSIGAPKVRRARLTDASELLLLMADFNRAEGIPFRRARVIGGLRRLLREPRLGIVVVAESADRRRLDGYAIGTFGFDLEFAGPDAFLTELFVRAESRRHGLGARLLAAVTSGLRDAGARAVTLLVLPEHVGARRLYGSAGFEELPRIAMVRRLSKPKITRRERRYE
jgi:ribosomal protein S18 acetylase RimI-like enzyme